MGRDKPQTASAEYRFSLPHDRNRLLVTRIPVAEADFAQSASPIGRWRRNQKSLAWYC